MKKRAKKFAVGKVIKCAINHHPALIVVKIAVKAVQETNKLENTDFSNLNAKNIALHQLEKSVDKQLDATKGGKALLEAHKQIEESKEA
jgi:hypothetical protein